MYYRIDKQYRDKKICHFTNSLMLLSKTCISHSRKFEIINRFLFWKSERYTFLVIYILPSENTQNSKELTNNIEIRKIITLLAAWCLLSKSRISHSRKFEMMNRLFFFLETREIYLSSDIGLLKLKIMRHYRIDK